MTLENTGSLLMSDTIVIVALLNCVITVVGVLAYAVRIVGVRSGKIAVSFSLFNIMALISRTANVMLAPLLAKYVERGNGDNLLLKLNMILFASGCAALLGAAMIPTFQRVFYRMVQSFSVKRSVPRLLMHSFSKNGILQFRECLRVPSGQNISGFSLKGVPKRMMLLEFTAIAVTSISFLSCVYAGTLAPELRATCITMSGVINSIAAIIVTIFLDPQLSLMIDEVIEGKRTEGQFRNCVRALVASRVSGIFCSMLLLVPAAYWVIVVARHI